MAVRATNEVASNRRGRARRAWGFFWMAASILLLTGCTADSYRRSADKRANAIVMEYQARALHQSNAFRVDTSYTSRKLADISPAELIDDRIQTNQRVLTVEAAIDLAVKNSPTYQQYKEALFTTALNLSNERHKYGPQPAAGGGANWNRDSQGNESGTNGSFFGAGRHGCCGRAGC